MKTLGSQKYSASNKKILRNKQVGFFLKAEQSHLILIHGTVSTEINYISQECHMIFLIMAFILPGV